MTNLADLQERQVDRARIWLSDLVISQAEACAMRVGFGWEPSCEAPNHHDQMCAEFKACAGTGRPMRVATNSGRQSLLTPEASVAMHFWRNVTRVESGQEFNITGDLAVAHVLLDAVTNAGEPESSVAWEMLRAEIVGQDMVFAITGAFVPDLMGFICSALRTGLPFAVLEAVEQIENRPVTNRHIEVLILMLLIEL